MYEAVFDKLKRQKIKDDSSADLIKGWSVSKILGFAQDLFYLIEADSSPTNDNLGIDNYSFIANSNMSAYPGSGCFHSKCRLNRIEQLARFNILYSDVLYLPNYFAYYQHSLSSILDEYDKESLRLSVAGDVKILLKIKPLLLSGIAKFLPTIVMLCSACFQEISQNISRIDARLTQQIRLLEASFAGTTSAQLRRVDCSSSYLHQRYEIEVTCDDELFDHGKYIEIGTRIPRILQRKLDKNPSQQQINLTKSDILRSHINRSLLEDIASDISLLKSYQEKLSLKYLTNRHIDVSLLSALNDDRDFRDYNEIFANYLAFELPVFQNVPIETLLVIRNNEKDSFFSYRTALNSILKQHVFQRKAISSQDAKDIYSDVLYPHIKQLNNKVRTIRKSSLMRSLTRLAVATGALTFGLCSNFITPSFQSALYSLGLVTAYDSAKSIRDTIRPHNEIRNDNFYFLWKLSKKSKI